MEIGRDPGVTYRQDIDGLRAIAVLAVILFHFGVPGFQGGFVGVDVFFVISGFLIGGLLWRELTSTGRIRLGAFYMRRIRRLAPAFFTMAFVSCAFAWVILLPFDLREFGKGLIAATVYLSNVLFFRQAGYFDTSAEEKVLLHTWSLSVEEQFYIALPIILLVLARFRGFVPTLLSLCFAASLAATIWLTPTHQTAVFYLFPFRAWELLSGVLLAIWMAQGRVLPFGSALVALGLILIAGSILFIAPGAGFPGFWAVFPVLGTVLVLGAGGAQGLLWRGLTHPVPVFVGLISYALYLWHWPILVLSHYWRGHEAGFWETVFWIAVTFGAAYLSWRFVERPLRDTTRFASPKLLLGTVLASALLLGFGALVFKQDGIPTRFSPDVRLHIDASADFLQDFSRCHIASDGALKGLEVCPIGPANSAPRVLIWGDSHVRAFHAGLSLAADEAEMPALIVWTAGCPPFFRISKEESAATRSEDRACTWINTQMRTALPQLDGIDRLLLIGRWSYYAEGSGTGRDRENTISLSENEGLPGDGPIFERAARHTVAQMNETFDDVFVLRQMPEISNYDSRIAARALAHGRETNDEVLTQMYVARDAAEERAKSGTEVFRSLASERQIHLLDPWPEVCSKDHCTAKPGIYFDNNHVTNTGALELRGIFAPVFAPQAKSEVSE